MTITEVFDRLGVPYLSSGHEHTRPGWVQADCPDCGLTGHWRLGFDERRPGRCACWACGPKRLGDVLQSLSGESWQTVRPYLVALYGSPQHAPADDRKRGRYDPPETGDLKPIHKRYLEGRGFDWKRLVRFWGVRAVVPHQADRHRHYAWNLFVPVTHRFEAVSFTTRSVNPDAKLRYVSASKDMEKVDHKSLLYGQDLVPGNTVVVHEGPFDVWRTGPGAVCTFGTAFSPAQVEKIARYPVRVVCYDFTPEGQDAARKLCDRLDVFPGETHHVQSLGGAKDAAEASEADVRRLRETFGLPGYGVSNAIKSL